MDNFRNEITDMLSTDIVGEIRKKAEKKAMEKTAVVADEYNKAQSLVRYTLTKMQESDPVGFINFVLGGYLGEHSKMIEEADVIARDFDEHAPWVESDAEFNTLVKDYQQANPKYKENDIVE